MEKQQKSILGVRMLTVLLYILFSLTFIIWLLVFIILFSNPIYRKVNLVNIMILTLLAYFTLNPLYGILKLRSWKKRVISGEEKTFKHPWKTFAFVIIIFIVISLLFPDEIKSFGGGLWGIFFAIIMSTGTGISSYRSMSWIYSKWFKKKVERSL